MTPHETDPHAGLSAREREIMDIVFRLRQATAVDIRRQMSVPPTNATVRSTLRVLETKGWVEHSRDGARFVYGPVVSRERVKSKALGHLVRTFFVDLPDRQREVFDLVELQDVPAVEVAERLGMEAVSVRALSGAKA